MKVPGSDGKDKVAARIIENRANENSAMRRPDGLAQHLVQQESIESREASDTVSFSALGSFMQKELNGPAMADERRQKIEALKQQIKEGRYSPSSEAVAGSVAEEISLEVMFSGGALSNS